MTSEILAGPTAPCCYCDESLTFRRKLASEDQGPGQGDTSAAWRHPDGSIYKQRAVKCRRCDGRGHMVPSGEQCRSCFGTSWVRVDDHCATPNRSAR